MTRRPSIVVLAAATAVALASLPPVRRGLRRLLVLTTGTVVRDQRLVR
ncbi:hypothetical protein [Rhizomonospora bruguierae]|nr:hypothetical protein [Micromonospora sp. NBRC 107566]